jgi:NitT/TauT family transport system substrate-binding protein
MRARMWMLGRTRLVLAALLAVVLLLAACNGDDETAEPEPDEPDADVEEPEPEPDDDVEEPDPEPDEDAAADDGDMDSITVGDIAGTPSAFLSFAVEQGFFEDEGLDVTVEVSPGGAANIPGVMAGDFEIAGSNIVSVTLACGEGLPLRMVSAGTFATQDAEEDFSAVLVLPDSGIEDHNDLDGRSVAVNTLANIAELTIRASLDNLGAEHENIDFVEMPFPDMLPALQDGNVDAVHVIEPFMSLGLQQDMRSVLVPYNQTEPGLAIGSYFASDDYIEANPDVVDRFVAGVATASDYIADNPDEFRDALPELAGLEPEVAETVNVPDWGGEVDVGSVELIVERMVEFDIIADPPPIDDLVYTP